LIFMDVLICFENDMDSTVFINFLFLKKLLTYTRSNLIKIVVNCCHVLLSIYFIKFVKIGGYAKRDDVT
jgi:hypothetical protein